MSLPACDHIDATWLSQRQPLQRLGATELELLAQQTPVLHAAQGECLIEIGSLDERALYLVRGKLRVVAEDGRPMVITERDPRALEPISQLTPHHYDVFCASDALYCWVPSAVLQRINRQQSGTSLQLEDWCLPPAVAENRLFQRIYQALLDDQLLLPLLPDVAVRLRNIVAGGGQVDDRERLFFSDPALAVWLLRCANSPVFAATQPVGGVHEACERLGPDLLNRFVIPRVTGKLFTSHTPFTKKRMIDLWKHSTEVASVCHVLAREHAGFDPEHAMLLGLVHDIGMLPIIVFSDLHPHLVPGRQQLDELIRDLHGTLGALLMHKWNFPEEFVRVAEEADDWYRDPTPTADYSDIVLLAQLHSFIGKQLNEQTPPLENASLPHLHEVPAFHKLGFAELDPHHSSAILSRARQDFHELKHLLIAS